MPLHWEREIASVRVRRVDFTMWIPTAVLPYFFMKYLHCHRIGIPTLNLDKIARTLYPPRDPWNIIVIRELIEAREMQAIETAPFY